MHLFVKFSAFFAVFYRHTGVTFLRIMHNTRYSEFAPVQKVYIFVKIVQNVQKVDIFVKFSAFFATFYRLICVTFLRFIYITRYFDFTQPTKNVYFY